MNSSIFNAKQEILDCVNKQLNNGVPIASISLILEVMLREVNEQTKNVISREQEEFKEQVHKEEGETECQSVE